MVNTSNGYGWAMLFCFLLGVLVTYAVMSDHPEEHPYLASDFQPASSNYDFIVFGSLADFWGEWAFHFKGQYNGHDFKQRIELIDDCQFAMKLSLSDGRLTYDIADWAKEKLDKEQTEMCVLQFARQIDSNVHSMVNNRAQHS